MLLLHQMSLCIHVALIKNTKMKTLFVNIFLKEKTVKIDLFFKE